MVKEMWTPPLARWAGTCFDCTKPDGAGAVFWIRDDNTFSTGWFGSWYGPGWAPDWPAGASNSPTGSGQGGAQFCVNCHAATVSGNTFVSMRNYSGKDVHHFLTQFVPDLPPATPHHMLVALPGNRVSRLGEALYNYDDSFVGTFKGKLAAPDWGTVDRMPSQTYDDVIVGGRKKVILGSKDPVYFQTSTQCLGCHTANATGLQFDMVAPVPQSDQAKLGGALFDISPYALWASSPMGLAGRDPIFFAMLESEQQFHKQETALVQDTCLQCHGIMGQRQFALDAAGGDCGQFQRSLANVMDENVGSDSSVGPHGVSGDDDYKHGGGDHLAYIISNLSGQPVQIRATLYYQSIAPYFLQDRFCVAPDGPDTQRLYFLAGHLNLGGTEVDGWKLKIAQSSVMCNNSTGLFRCS